MPVIENPTFEDYDSILGYLDYPSGRWNAENDLGTNVIITYSFPQGDDLPAGGGSYGVDGFEGFNAAQQDAFRSVFDQIEAFAGVRFIEIESDAMIDGMIGLNGDGISGYASFPNVYGDHTGTSDAVMVYTGFDVVGSFSYYVALHEIGHAMGLEHTHEGAHSPDEGDDITANSVMTYNYSPIPDVYGTFDVAALRHIYGDNGSTATWDVSVHTSGRIKMVGSRGADTVVTSSSDNIVFAGWGNDTIYGREAKDLLVGQNGHDFLDGGAGRDVLRGGNGNDTLIGGKNIDILTGGNGADTFVFSWDDWGKADRIKDFAQGQDKIDVSALNLNFDYLSFSTHADGSTLIVDAYNLKIHLKGRADLELVASDFIFDDVAAIG